MGSSRSRVKWCLGVDDNNKMMQKYSVRAEVRSKSRWTTLDVNDETQVAMYLVSSPSKYSYWDNEAAG